MNNSRLIDSSVTGVMLGVAAGATAYMMSAMGSRGRQKKMKRRAEKAVREVGNFIDTVSGMVRN